MPTICVPGSNLLLCLTKLCVQRSIYHLSKSDIPLKATCRDLISNLAQQLRKSVTFLVVLQILDEGLLTDKPFQGMAVG